MSMIRMNILFYRSIDIYHPRDPVHELHTSASDRINSKIDQISAGLEQSLLAEIEQLARKTDAMQAELARARSRIGRHVLLARQRDRAIRTAYELTFSTVPLVTVQRSASSGASRERQARERAARLEAAAAALSSNGRSKSMPRRYLDVNAYQLGH